MNLNDNISLRDYFQREIEHVHAELREIKTLVQERGLRTFQVEEMTRELEKRVQTNETTLKWYGRALGAVSGALGAIIVNWLSKLLGL